MADRYFENKFGQYDQTIALVEDNFQLCKTMSDPINEFITVQLQLLRKVFSESSSRKYDSRDSSVYTGLSGIVVLTQKLHATRNPIWEPLLGFQNTLLSKMCLRGDGITFFCGDPGPLVVHIVECHAKGDDETVKRYVDMLLKFAQQSKKKKMDNEMLYGRAGYLYSLLKVKQLSSSLIPDSVIQQIVADIVNAGVEGAAAKGNRCVLPLYYEWYKEEYVGAAHGYVGIFYMILQAATLHPGCLSEQHEQLVVASIDALLNLRYPSGNLPACVGDARDELMHWCHGGPGAIHLYALAYKRYKKPQYLSACKMFADDVWARGLLKRGYGLCHGVAGNGYALLCMYQLTGEAEYLWRATRFAEWCLSYGEHGCRVPDTPYSLFEGLAGTLYFLNDILAPKDAMFPAFQLVPYF